MIWFLQISAVASNAASVIPLRIAPLQGTLVKTTSNADKRSVVHDDFFITDKQVPNLAAVVLTELLQALRVCFCKVIT